MRRLLPPDADETTRAWVIVACFMLAVVVALTPAGLLDTRQIEGANAWTKPIKFALSLALHFATLAFLVRLLPREVRVERRIARFVTISVAAALFEIFYITYQALRGRPSHFNFQTAAETGMYALMGIGATLLIVIPFVLGMALLRQEDSDRSGLRLGALLGLLGAPVLTFIVTAYMSGVVYGRWIGVPVSGVNMPVLGWSREVGDLRPSHFVALHALQILPLAGWITDRVAPVRARPVVWSVALLTVAATILLFVQAVAGSPLWPR